MPDVVGFGRPTLYRWQSPSSLDPTLLYGFDELHFVQDVLPREEENQPAQHWQQLLAPRLFDHTSSSASRKGKEGSTAREACLHVIEFSAFTSLA